jgi:hypothetical protein
MPDAVTINLDDAPIAVEKRDHGRHHGSKNKAKIPTMASTSTMPV